MKIKKVVMAICATLLAAVSFGVAACSGCNSCNSCNGGSQNNQNITDDTTGDNGDGDNQGNDDNAGENGGDDQGNNDNAGENGGNGSGSETGGDDNTQTHTHTFATEWTWDETYHWHSATCEHTDEVADRAKHVYVDGLCSVCGAEEPFRLKEDTDFDALISDKVTAEEWQAAFDEENFKNVTLKLLVDNETYATFKKEYREDAQFTLMQAIPPENTDSLMPTEIGTETTENNRWMYQTNAQGDSIKIDINALASVDETAGETYIDAYDNWMSSYEMVCPNFGDFFERFTYDEELGAYVFEGTDDDNYDDDIETNAIFAYWNEHYWRAVVKIVDGKIAYIESQINSTNIYYIHFYDYDYTVVELPEAEIVDVSQIY